MGKWIETDKNKNKNVWGLNIIDSFLWTGASIKSLVKRNFLVCLSDVHLIVIKTLTHVIIFNVRICIISFAQHDIAKIGLDSTKNGN